MELHTRADYKNILESGRALHNSVDYKNMRVLDMGSQNSLGKNFDNYSHNYNRNYSYCCNYRNYYNCDRNFYRLTQKARAPQT